MTFYIPAPHVHLLQLVQQADSAASFVREMLAAHAAQWAADYDRERPRYNSDGENAKRLVVRPDAETEQYAALLPPRTRSMFVQDMLEANAAEWAGDKLRRQQQQIARVKRSKPGSKQS